MHNPIRPYCLRFGLMAPGVWLALLVIFMPPSLKDTGLEPIDYSHSTPEWIEFSPTSAPFSLRLPGRPIESRKDLDSGARGFSYGLETSDCEFRAEWVMNLPNEMSRAGALGRLFGRVVRDIRTHRGSDDSKVIRDGDIVVDHIHGRETIMQSPRGRIQIWGFLLTTQDIERPSPGHDFVALIAREDGSESAFQDSQIFFGSLSLYCPPLMAPPLDDNDIPPSDAALDTRPVPLNHPKPSYTFEATKARLQGIIKIRALVGVDGAVKSVRLISHLPRGLDEEAIIAAKQIRFRPAIKAGKPVATWVSLDVDFRLPSR